MKIKKLNNKPDLFGKIEIEIYPAQCKSLGMCYCVKCNGKGIAVYNDFWTAVQKVKNGIYGYPTEYLAY
jgi:hypothetical protein